MGVRMVALFLTVLVMIQLWMATAQQFSVVHKYAQMEGSPANSGGQGSSPEYAALLQAHDRRRLAVVADFPVQGDSDPNSIGLYYTEIGLGTPARQFFVQVDTGSDILWLNCAPCIGCPAKSGIGGVTLQLYTPSQSSTETVVGCKDTACVTASDGDSPTCTSSDACEYSIKYGDGSTTTGYFINDVLTFQQVDNATTVNATANVFFGCGTTQTGNLLESSRAIDGIMGFGQSAASVPSQLAALGKVGRVFAHCLQGDDLGGGTFVIGNILETNLSYTPLVVGQPHYNVVMQNIAVNGVNISSPATFEITASGEGGVIIDSGTTLAYLPESAFTQFVDAISQGAPVQPVTVRSGGESLTCWVYSGDIDTSFPTVTLFFDGGAVMNLVASNYLYDVQVSGSTGHCMAWGSADSYTLLGDIVLKNQLVVYNNDNHTLGWKPYDCTQSIRVSAPNSTSSGTVTPGSSGGSSGGGAAAAAIRVSAALLSSCLAISFLGSVLLL